MSVVATVQMIDLVTKKSYDVEICNNPDAGPMIMIMRNDDQGKELSISVRKVMDLPSLEEVVETLEFYADRSNHIGKDLYSNPGQDFPYGKAPSKVEEDGGKKARNLLGIK